MKFSEIPQFTKSGSYEVDIPLDHLERALEDYKTDYNLELNPDFQRGNVWTKEQQTAYLEFFFRGGKTARVIYFNCPALGGTQADDCSYPDMVCVDGLQRLTAFLGFLHNEIPIFGHFYSEFTDKLRMVGNSIRFNVNALQTKEQVLQWYIEMNTGGTVHAESEINRVKQLLELERKNSK